MVGCLLFNTATLTILLANFGPYGNFINGIEHEPREEFRDYAYLRICAKNFPWGDGKHCLLFNEEALPLPGKGYIREEELHVPLLLTLRNLFNMLLSFYFLVLGIFALSHMVSPFVLKLVPSAVPVIPFHLQFTQGEGDARESVVDYQFNTHDLVCLGLCSVVGVWYIMKKHWLANDLLGMAFAINGVELLHLNNVVTGCILLGGLFFYDIFWVFGTDVMVTVAKSFEAPIKLVFPQDLLENGPMGASNFAMLGLGDIVIPGIFIALLLRYDNSLKHNSNFYFTATFVAYLAGLLLTIFVMHVYKHAQPALLYLVPACLGVPLFLALVRGDIKSMFQYEDHPNIEEKKTN